MLSNNLVCHIGKWRC